MFGSTGLRVELWEGAFHGGGLQNNGDEDQEEHVRDSAEFLFGAEELREEAVGVGTSAEDEAGGGDQTPLDHEEPEGGVMC